MSPGADSRSSARSESSTRPTIRSSTTASAPDRAMIERSRSRPRAVQAPRCRTAPRSRPAERPSPAAGRPRSARSPCRRAGHPRPGARWRSRRQRPPATSSRSAKASPSGSANASHAATSIRTSPGQHRPDLQRPEHGITRARIADRCGQSRRVLTRLRLSLRQPQRQAPGLQPAVRQSAAVEHLPAPSQAAADRRITPYQLDRGRHGDDRLAGWIAFKNPPTPVAESWPQVSSAARKASHRRRAPPIRPAAGPATAPARTGQPGRHKILQRRVDPIGQTACPSDRNPRDFRDPRDFRIPRTPVPQMSPTPGPPRSRCSPLRFRSCRPGAAPSQRRRPYITLTSLAQPK